MLCYLDVGVKRSILTLDSSKYSSRAILNALSARNITVTQKGVCNVIKQKCGGESRTSLTGTKCAAESHQSSRGWLFIHTYYFAL